MNESRKYAEELVGPLQTSHFNTQRDVTKDIYQTNWDDIKNQYKNLTEELAKSRQASNTAFETGLGQVMENSLDRGRTSEQNLANRGLNVSGIRDIAQQADTTQKGQDVLSLLGNMGNQLTVDMETLKKGGESVNDQIAQLNSDLGGTLGDIGSAQTSAQMAYNEGLAGLAGSKDARDMDNELQAMQRAAADRAAARSGSGTQEEEDLEELYKRQAILGVLQGVNPETGEELGFDDAQKANTLKILFGVDNAEDVISAFNTNKGGQSQIVSDINDEMARVRTNINDATDDYDRVARALKSGVNQDASTQKSLNEELKKYKTIIDNENTVLSNWKKDLETNTVSFDELAQLLYGQK